MSGLLGIGTSALLANQRALAVTGNNIANANTEGYSRQRVDFSARHVPGQMLGQGVESGLIERYTDSFANQRLTQSVSSHASVASGADLAGRLDLLLSDPATGLSDPLRAFVDAVDAWAADPNATETRVQLLGQAETIAQRFGQVQDGLDSFTQEINTRVGGAVDRINTLSQNIAELNDQIALNGGLGSGQQPNGLLDERDRLVNELASLIDVQTVPQDDGSLNVMVGNGQGLVVGKQTNLIGIEPGATPVDPVSVTVAGSDISAQISGGELGGLMAFRRDVLEPAQQDLSALAQGLADTVNAAQAAGVDANGVTGTALFATSPPSARLEVLLDDPQTLASAPAGAAAGSGDNSNALALADALRGPAVNGLSLQDAHVALVSGVGSSARRLEATETAEAALMANNLELRDAVSGVNLDEEAANMLRYQQAYQAAAQIIATANEMFESLLAAAR